MRAANRARLSPSAFARSLLIQLSDAAVGAGDPAAAIAAVAQALGLAPDASPEELQEAFSALLEGLQPSGDDSAAPASADPSASSADAQTETAASLGISVGELAACNKKGLDPREYVQLKAAAVQRVGATRREPVRAPVTLSREIKAKLRALNMTEAEFSEAKLKAVRRV